MLKLSDNLFIGSRVVRESDGRTWVLTGVDYPAAQAILVSVNDEIRVSFAGLRVGFSGANSHVGRLQGFRREV